MAELISVAIFRACLARINLISKYSPRLSKMSDFPAYSGARPFDAPPDAISWTSSSHTLCFADYFPPCTSITAQPDICPFGRVQIVPVNRQARAALAVNPAPERVIGPNSVAALVSASVPPLNLSRRRLLHEIWRVLAPGGCAIFCDIVSRGAAIMEGRNGVLHRLGCVPGSLTETEYGDQITSAGLRVTGVEPVQHDKVPDVEWWCTRLGFSFLSVAHPDGSVNCALWSVTK